jgi:SAM-dependent methyltransferase
MIDVSCNLCRKNDYTVLFGPGVAQSNQIVKCNHCGLMYANPRESDADQDKFKEYDPNWTLQHSDQRFDKESLQIRDYRKTRDFLRKIFPYRGKLIEIGSGFGYLLNFLKQDGWDVMGLEPLKGCCQFSESEFGIKAIPKIIEEAALDENSVDVVLMMHVIEHVPDPFGTFKEVYRVLRPGGYFILETPRYDTLMFKLLGKRERSLSCDGHIYFFTSDTLKNMATNAGFKVQINDYVGRSLTLERLVWNIGVISKSDSVKQALKWISTKLRFKKIWLKLNMRDMQRMYLRKQA